MLQLVLGGALAGLLVLLVTPSLGKSTQHSTAIGNAYATIAMRTLRRPAISISENTEFSLRRRAYDATYRAEKVADGSDTTAYISKLSGTIQRWGQRPFTFVDEKFGTTFDLRDVAVARRIVENERDGQMVVSDRVRNEHGRLQNVALVRAFVELSERAALTMDLGESIHPITDGSEDAHAWDRVYEAVRRMFLPYQSSVPLLKLALPMLAVVGGFFAGFYLFGPGQLPGAPSTGSTVSVGAATLLLLGAAGGDDDEGNDLMARIRDRLEAVERATWIRLGTSVAIVSVVGGALWVAPLAAVAVGGGAVAVIAGLPLLSATLVSALPAAVAEPVADTWMTLGLGAFADPIIRQTDAGTMRIDECGALPTVGASPRYRFCKSYVGFTCDVDPDAFGAAAIPGSELGEYRSPELIADGGDGSDLAPEGWTATDRITNGGHRGMVPAIDAPERKRRQWRSSTWVRTDRWLARFRDAATGRMAERAQQEATKEFAGGDPQFTDRQIMLFGLGGLFVGLGMSFVLWGGVLF